MGVEIISKNIKLCYIFIKGEKDKDIEINLDNELEFVWDGKYLTIDKKENYIDGFYGENINNFNLIIGQNGSGKTHHLKKIIEATHSLNGKMIKIVKIDEMYFVFHWNGFEIENYIKNVEIIGKENIITETYKISEYGIGEYDLKSAHYKNIKDKSSGYQSIFFTNQFSISTQDFESISDGLYHPYNSGLKHLLRFPDKMFGEGPSNKIVNIYDNYFYYLASNFYVNPVSEEVLKGFKLERPAKISIINTNLYELKELLNKLKDHIEV